MLAAFVAVIGVLAFLPDVIRFLADSAQLVGFGALLLVAAYGVRSTIHVGLYLRVSSGRRLIGFVFLQIIFGAIWLIAAMWAFEDASGLRIAVVDVAGLAGLVTLNHLLDGARRAAGKPRASKVIRAWAEAHLRPPLRRLYLGWLVDVITLVLPRPRASTFMLGLAVALAFNLVLSLPAAGEEIMRAIEKRKKNEQRDRKSQRRGLSEKRNATPSPHSRRAADNTRQGGIAAEPRWADLCAGASGPSSAPAPVQQRRALERAFAHHGAKEAGCTPSPSSPVDRTKPHGSWTQVGYCDGRPLSLAVADANGVGGLLMGRQPVAVGQVLTEQRVLLSNSGRFPVLSGSAYIISTTRGNAVLVQPRMSTGRPLTDARSCRDLPQNALPFAELPPEMAARWAGLNETGFTWPYSDNGSLATGDGSFRFLSPDTGRTVATGRCRGGACALEVKAGLDPTPAPVSRMAVERASRR